MSSTCVTSSLTHKKSSAIRRCWPPQARVRTPAPPDRAESLGVVCGPVSLSLSLMSDVALHAGQMRSHPRHPAAPPAVHQLLGVCPCQRLWWQVVDRAHSTHCPVYSAHEEGLKSAHDAPAEPDHVSLCVDAASLACKGHSLGADDAPAGDILWASAKTRVSMRRVGGFYGPEGGCRKSHQKLGRQLLELAAHVARTPRPAL